MTLRGCMVAVINHGMKQTQGGHGGSRSGRVPAQIYVDPKDWLEFDVISRAQNRSRSAQIRELIRREIETFDPDARASWKKAA